MIHLSLNKLLLFPLASLLFATNLNSCNEANKKPGSSKPAVEANDELFAKYNLDKIRLPEGFAISVYAEVPNARSLSISPSGTVFVGNRKGENVYAVVDSNKDGKADKVYVVASGLKMPNGVAFHNGSLYIATVSSIYRIDSIEQKLENPGKPVLVTDTYPSDTHHGWKFIAFGPDGKLYVPVGAPCNICESEKPIYATITRMNADGSGMEIYAKGIRNTVGFAWHPNTKELWFTENGADNMGDNVPYCELNKAPRPGLHFGYPYCHQGNILDAQFGKGKNCNDYTAPMKNLGPHIAPLGMRFYTASQFPAAYHNQIFIAEHGSWNRSTPIGYKVSLATLDEEGNVTAYTPFAEGWLQPDGKVLGRPVDVEILADGSMLVSDDYSDVIYRITHK